MITRALVKPNIYRDSVSLMSMSNKVSQLDGVEQAFVAMGTEMNKGVLSSLGLLGDELAGANTGDMMVVVVGADEPTVDGAFALVEELLQRKADQGGGRSRRTYHTVASAATDVAGANLAIIAVGGAFAAREARQALENDLHVIMFSDNVAVEDEIALKSLAHDKGLLMMGCSMALAGLVRGLLPERLTGWLAVRNRTSDIVFCTLMAVALIVTALVARDS